METICRNKAVVFTFKCAEDLQMISHLTLRGVSGSY